MPVGIRNENWYFMPSVKSKNLVSFSPAKRDPKSHDRPQPEELAYFETGISVIKKIKLIIMTGPVNGFFSQRHKPPSALDCD